MAKGIMGNILHVDLAAKKSWKEKLDTELLQKFLGPRGILAKFLWEKTDENTKPLSPDNLLMFGSGTLTGTSVPSSGRSTVTFRSPATGLYGKSSVGGEFGLRLKLTGNDILVIHQKAEKPVYLYIDNDKVEIRDASKLWGKDVREVYDVLTEIHGNNTDVASIGPAGENLVNFAAIMCTVYNAAARTGGGAVMGSKNLKSIVVKGEGKVQVANPKPFYDSVVLATGNVKRDTALQGLSEFGTSVATISLNEVTALPAKNFQLDHLDNADEYSGQKLVESNYLKGRVGCASCPVSCHRHSTVNSGPFEGTDTVGPEYETFNAIGAGCLIDIESTIKANDLCNIYGLDTISTGGVIQWAMECYQKGVLKKEDVDGLDLSWGNDKAVLDLIDKIAHREGFGDLLAKGLKEASEEVGHESWKWAIQAKGLEQSRVDTRRAKAYALAFAVNPRGPDHLHTETFAEFGSSEAALEVIEKITGNKKYARVGITDKRAEIVRWHEDIYAATESLGLCVFLTTAGFALDEEQMARLFETATGISMNKGDLMEAGRRTVTLERAYNIRNGYTRENDILPWRIMNEPASNSKDKESVTSKEELHEMLNRYYELHDWDHETGMPTVNTLQELGLEDVAEELVNKELIKKT